MHTESPFGCERDNQYMREALIEGQKAFKAKEVPIGAVLVDGEGNIIARAHNKVEASHTQLAHAECQVVRQAGEIRGDWRLEDCWLYVTLEPCAMCMYALVLSRLAGVVYGAPSPLFGYQLDKDMALWVYKRGALQIVSGVMDKQAADLLKQFFKLQRKKDEYEQQAISKSSEG